MDRYYRMFSDNVNAKLYTASYFASSSFGNNLPMIGGMAHPHLPQTYYLIARNNFVALR